ncbi:hypothetical protein KM924_11830 [Brevibacillus parabrevis]|jgi:hypothetical protein|uniref:hypothetical protein n=2 Tax=Brevibacillus TaxID=55080 RepID=UPI000F0A5FC2|nr:hypothetical protein [Brevibacillus parabrevis]MBU8713188.1 hypothetical protein [Brevibacillus parabrevis]NRQ55064.1 hypothetical protein [Brevibacillus sp. HD1.4A]RNB97397.1 hypothetical protein EDM60_00775 [Brevibacillus parabrevis]
MMKKLLMYCANAVIAVWFVVLWLYKMMLSSDIPMSISSAEMQNMILTLLISTITVLLYVKLSSSTELFYFLVFPAFLWGFSMVQSFMNSYHEYNTLMAVSGFFCMSLIFASSSLNAKRLSKLP